MARVTIGYQLPADAVPPESILSGEPEFEITGNVYPYVAATREEDQHGGDAEIIEMLYLKPTSLEWIFAMEDAFRVLIESDLPLRHSIEDLLRAQAQSNVEQK